MIALIVAFSVFRRRTLTAKMQKSSIISNQLYLISHSVLDKVRFWGLEGAKVKGCLPHTQSDDGCEERKVGARWLLLILYWRDRPQDEKKTPEVGR